MPKKASKTKHVKGNDPREPALTRFKDVIIPPKMSKQIKPQAIFDGYTKGLSGAKQSDTNKDTKKKETKTKGKGKGKTG